MSGPVLFLLRLLLVGALYAFLGWVIWILWQDLRKSATAQLPPHLAQIDLVVRAGGAAKTLSFRMPEVVIGRDPACDCVLEDAAISARHARLSYHHNQWWVEDLHSRNGTHLNQMPVNEPVVVTTGDQLQCGPVILDIVLGESPIATVEREKVQA
ncbi:MAG: FHA domain-containing protein [Anaerolineales bacterium]|nr:FHA domain-containing protein [Anaerolineales bacterium]